jgi:hypothetical protein
VHWSELPQLHAKHAARIHESLLEQSWLRYFGRTYLWRPLTRAPAPVLPPDPA